LGQVVLGLPKYGNEEEEEEEEEEEYGGEYEEDEDDGTVKTVNMKKDGKKGRGMKWSGRMEWRERREERGRRGERIEGERKRELSLLILFLHLPHSSLHSPLLRSGNAENFYCNPN
jgi:hypothetical protein